MLLLEFPVLSHILRDKDENIACTDVPVQDALFVRRPVCYPNVSVQGDFEIEQITHRLYTSSKETQVRGRRGSDSWVIPPL